MKLDTLDIPPDEAMDKLAEYTSMLYEERTVEDEAIAMGYRAAARGLPLIRLSQTVLAGGFHDNGLPRIAIINADAKECFVRWDGPELVFGDRNDWNVNRGALVGAHSVRIPFTSESVPDRQRRWTNGATIVPIIPPRYRPRLRRLRHRHILWEVEEWKRLAPRDPALLRHVRGDLWAVLAVWDLTPLERYVLSQR